MPRDMSTLQTMDISDPLPFLEEEAMEYDDPRPLIKDEPEMLNLPPKLVKEEGPEKQREV